MTESNRSNGLARRVVELALAKKGEDVLLMDLRGVLDVTDFFVIATGYSEIQVQAIADSIVDGCREAGEAPSHVEGRDSGHWVLIDFIDVVAHVMLPEEREKYKLDRLWGDAAYWRYDETGAVVEERPATRDDEPKEPPASSEQETAP